MKKILTAVALITVSAMAWETTLTENATLILPAVKTSIGVANRQASETITNGHYRKIGNTVVVAKSDGVTSDAMATNKVVSNNESILVVTGTLDPDATGEYLKSDVGT